MDLDLLIEVPEWEPLDLPRLAQAAADAALVDLGLDPKDFGLSILACDDARIAALNTDFRGKHAPTNVLSWPSEDRAPGAPGAMPVLPRPEGQLEELGDLALAYQTCAREAADSAIPLSHHVTHLVVHGLLHCLGFDHETDADAELMERIETRILVRLGVPDPY